MFRSIMSRSTVKAGVSSSEAFMLFLFLEFLTGSITQPR